MVQVQEDDSLNEYVKAFYDGEFEGFINSRGDQKFPSYDLDFYVRTVACMQSDKIAERLPDIKKYLGVNDEILEEIKLAEQTANNEACTSNPEVARIEYSYAKKSFMILFEICGFDESVGREVKHLNTVKYIHWLNCSRGLTEVQFSFTQGFAEARVRYVKKGLDYDARQKQRELESAAHKKKVNDKRRAEEACCTVN